jgi:hypothetical protein
MAITGLGVGAIIDPTLVCAALCAAHRSMILRRTMTPLSLVLDTFTETATRERNVERGSRPGAPLRSHERRAQRRPEDGMTPILAPWRRPDRRPGMTRQILAGLDPVEATKYQVLIIFLIASAALRLVLQQPQRHPAPHGQAAPSAADRLTAKLKT